MSETKTVAAPARDQFKPLTKVESLGELFRHPEFAKRINQAIPSHMSGERMLRTIVTAVQKTPKLAQVNPMSMLGACITIAALGLEPNTPLQHAHLIPFEVNKYNRQTKKYENVRTDVQLIIGYPGYVDLIYRSGLVKDIDCQVFYEDEVASGAFSYERGSNKHLKHKPSDKIRKPDEEPAGAYMYATLPDGGEVFEVLSLAKVHLARSRSQGFRAAMYAHDDAIRDGKDPKKDKRYSEAPWIKDFEAMARKTALRAGQKWLPKSIELAAALGTDEAPIDFSKLNDASMVFDGTYEVVPEDGPTESEVAEVAPDKVQAEKQEAKKTTAAPKTTEARTAAPATAKAKPAEPAPQPAEQPPPVENVTYFPMFNEWGEEDDGPSGPLTSAIDFATRFAERYSSLNQANREAYLDYNAESVGAARNGSDKAADILASVLVPKAAAKPAEETKLSFEVRRKKTAAGGWDLKSYLSDTAMVLQGISSIEQLEVFTTQNGENAAKLPPAAKGNFQTMVDLRRQELAPAVDQPAEDVVEDEIPMDDEPPAEEAVPDIELPPQDQWDVFADRLRKDFADAGDQHELRGFISFAAIQVKLRSLKDARPDLATKLDAEYEARLNELKTVKA